MTLTETIYGDSAAELAAPADEVTLDIPGLRLVLAALIDAPANEVYMGSWDCGTSACAVGWFCRRHPGDELKIVPSAKDHRIANPVYRGVVGFAAVADRFGLYNPDADRLFGDEAPKGKAGLIERLTAFIEEHQTFSEHP